MKSMKSMLFLALLFTIIALTISSDFHPKEKSKTGLSTSQNFAPTLSPTSTNSTFPSTSSPSIQYVYGPLKITRSHNIVPTLQPTTSIPSVQPSFYSFKNPNIITYSSINYFQSVTTATTDFPSSSPVTSKLNLKEHLDNLGTGIHYNYLSAISSIPSLNPSQLNSASPSTSYSPSIHFQPTVNPSVRPSTTRPTFKATIIPTSTPTSLRPTLHSSGIPTLKPSTAVPTAFLSAEPSQKRSAIPSSVRSLFPSSFPSTVLSAVPSKVPLPVHSVVPSALPRSTVLPSVKPSSSFIPSKKMTAVPSTKLSSLLPQKAPSMVPSVSHNPSRRPTRRPKSRSPTRVHTVGSSSAPALYLPSNAPNLANPSSNHVSPPKSSSPTYSSAPSTVPSYSPSFTDLSYHNGSVMTGVVNLYNIYFGDFTTTASDRPTPGLVDYFSQHIGNTSWFDMFSVFYEEKNGVRIPAASSSVLKASSHCNGGGKRLSIGMNDVTNCIVSSFSNGFPDPNGIYAVIFRGDFTWNSDSDELTWNSASGTNFCGFHSTFAFQINSSSSVLVKYFVVGDPSIENGNSGLITGCIVTLPPTANGNIGADNLLTTYAHELAECITDYHIDGWYADSLISSSNGGEVADLCNMNFGTEKNFNIVVGQKSFLIQQLFIPGRGCTMSLKSAAPTISPTFAPFKDPFSPATDDGSISAVPVTLPTTSPNLPADISYHGGYILGYFGEPIPLSNVFIGNFSTSTINLMNYFAENIGNTTWFDILHSYYDFDYYGQQIFVSNETTFIQSLSLTPASQQLTDLDIQTLLYNAIIDNSLISDTISVYTVMFPGYYNVTVNGKSWLKDWCSYHGSFAFNGGQILKYSVVGDPSSAPGTSGQVCEPVTGRPTANGDLAADSMAVGFAQQLANTITDFEGAWYSDQSGLEVSSLCNGDFGPGVKVTGPQGVNSNVVVGTRKFLLQSLWKPAVGCRMSYLTE